MDASQTPAPLPLEEKPGTGQDRKMSWSLPVVLIIGLGLITLWITTLFDLTAGQTFSQVLNSLVEREFDSAANAVGSLPEVLIGILGLTLTVSAIVVQLAAQRYTPKLVDLFLADRVNIFTILVMVFASVYCIWVMYSIRTNHIPVWSSLFLVLFTSLLLALLIPYFQYVFKFLTPSNILETIEANQQKQVEAATKQHGPSATRLKEQVANGLEQVSDIALSAVSQVDRNVALMSINTLCQMISNYIPAKDRMADAWYTPLPHHFISISSEFLTEIEQRKVWVEARGLMNLELLFNQALKNMPDAISAAAANTRQIALTAREANDGETLYLCLEYFNTFLRRAVNDRNQRAVFTLFYQYRRLAESLLATHRPLAEEIAHFLHYYGQESIRGGIPFLMLVAAMDLGTLLQIGYESRVKGMEPILDDFLKMSESQDVRKVAFVHKGVRKAHVILASYLMSTGNWNADLEKIRQSLSSETPEWLEEVKSELLAVHKKKFWEITDRGGLNFEYMEPERKEWMKKFYAKYLEASAK